MSIICIWAEARNGVIGRGDQLPWHIPQELEQFKKRTMGQTLLFGYRTLVGFKGRKLPGRTMNCMTLITSKSFVHALKTRIFLLQVGGRRTKIFSL